MYAQRPTVDRVLWPAPNRDREALLPLPLTLAAAAVFFSATPPLPVKLPPHGSISPTSRRCSYLADMSLHLCVVYLTHSLGTALHRPPPG